MKRTGINRRETTSKVSIIINRLHCWKTPTLTKSGLFRPQRWNKRCILRDSANFEIWKTYGATRRGVFTSQNGNFLRNRTNTENSYRTTKTDTDVAIYQWNRIYIYINQICAIQTQTIQPNDTNKQNYRKIPQKITTKTEPWPYPTGRKTPRRENSRRWKSHSTPPPQPFDGTNRSRGTVNPHAFHLLVLCVCSHISRRTLTGQFLRWSRIFIYRIRGSGSICRGGTFRFSNFWPRNIRAGIEFEGTFVHLGWAIVDG